jgi:hypothetical protein
MLFKVLLASYSWGQKESAVPYNLKGFPTPVWDKEDECWWMVLPWRRIPFFTAELKQDIILSPPEQHPDRGEFTELTIYDDYIE